MANLQTKPTHSRFQDLTGLIFARWTVLSYAGKTKKGDSLWFCRCECGTESSVHAYNLLKKKSKSCGCLSTIGKSRETMEKQMLSEGLSYAEIAWRLGTSEGGLKNRNEGRYKINIYKSFADKIEREGIPNRLNVTDDFGYWFSGFFDGEGTLTANVSLNTYIGYKQRRLGLSVCQRDDDASLMEIIRDTFGVGTVIHRQRTEKEKLQQPNVNPISVFRSHAIKDMAEIFVPFFEKYPLRTKKAREFLIWKELVIMKYIKNLGGKHHQRWNNTKEDGKLIEDKIKEIQAIRVYKGRG